MRTVTIKLPFRTPTINSLYYHIRKTGIKVLTREAREIRKNIEKIVVEQYFRQCDVLEGVELSVSVQIFENWYFKNGKVKKMDIANREKFLIDSVFSAIGIDDRYIFNLNFSKVQSIEEYSIIQITPLIKN